MLKIYNSQTSNKDIFKPITPNKITIYLCGITVYDDCHVGHARTVIAFDMMIRYLKYKGYEVVYVRNITDIDDKIIKKAYQNKENPEVLVARSIHEMHNMFDKLNILEPDFEPRVTKSMPEIISMISDLIDKGYAYKAENNDVYYRVKNFSSYGKLSGQNLDELQSGSRVEIDTNKEHAFDFVLWKASKENEPSWSSPWGDGRPGWHIECSAMIKKILGNSIDIHGGGSDLRFPHHENEIAQSEASNNCTLANFWVHSGMVNINEEKMSKSLNNFFTIKEVLHEYHPDVLRFFLISGHYRSELNYSYENLNQAKNCIIKIYSALEVCGLNTEMPLDANKYIKSFEDAMDNDFNTPEAIAVLFAIIKKINVLKIEKDLNSVGQYASLLKKLVSILGFSNYKNDSILQDSKANLNIPEIEINNLIEKRLEAKKNKEWLEADKIREILLSHGIILEDSASKTIWKRN